MTTDVTTRTPEEHIAQSILPETVLAYIAGILDGEGCICIKRQGGRLSHHNPTYNLVVRISNTVRSVIDFTQSYLGGGVYYHKNHTVASRDQFELSWNSQNAKRVLELLLPYLIIKRGLAELGIAFQEFVNTKISYIGRPTPLTSTELKIREIFYDRARTIQTRGKSSSVTDSLES